MSSARSTRNFKKGLAPTTAAFRASGSDLASSAGSMPSGKVQTATSTA